MMRDCYVAGMGERWMVGWSFFYEFVYGKLHRIVVLAAWHVNDVFR